jgi:xanthine dehydrogenase YagT iron-sulfur-binding subunit
VEDEMAISVNGKQVPVPDDSRMSLLDLLRERLGLTGTKVGCNQGACGACTVVLDGRRVLACLTLAVQTDGAEIVTIEALGNDESLHPLQRAFIEHDGLQCGYCTPGQICSAVAMMEEVRHGHPSAVTAELQSAPELTREEIRERMSGNLCRCGAHNGIVDAIAEVFAREAA